MKIQCILAVSMQLRPIAIVFAFSLAAFAACGLDAGMGPAIDSEIPHFSSFRDVPDISEEEISAVEAFARQGASFVFGNLVSTEAFYDIHGEIRGFAVLLCEWLSGLFGIPFEISTYEWNDLLQGLESGEIDFTSELTASEERRRTMRF